MNSSLNRRIQDILTAKHRRKIWYRIVAVLAAFVMLITSLELSSPADAATEDNSPVIAVESAGDIQPELPEDDRGMNEVLPVDDAEEAGSEAEAITAGETQALPEAEAAEIEPEADTVEPEADTAEPEADTAEPEGDIAEPVSDAAREEFINSKTAELTAESEIINDLRTQFVFSEDAAEFSRWITGVELERSYPVEKDENGSVIAWSPWEKITPADSLDDRPGQSEDPELVQSTGIKERIEGQFYEVHPEERLRFVLRFSIRPDGLELYEEYYEESQSADTEISRDFAYYAESADTAETITISILPVVTTPVSEITSYNRITYTLPQILSMAVSETGAVYSAGPAAGEEFLLQQEPETAEDIQASGDGRVIGYLDTQEDGRLPGGRVCITLLDSEAKANIIEDRSLDGVIELDMAAGDIVLPGEERQIVFRGEYESEENPAPVALTLLCPAEVSEADESATDKENTDSDRKTWRLSYALQGGRSVRLSDILTEALSADGSQPGAEDAEDYIHADVKSAAFSDPAFIAVEQLSEAETDGMNEAAPAANGTDAQDWLISNTIPYEGTGILTVVFADDSMAEIEITISGRQTVELAMATITPVDGSYLPEDVQGDAFIEEGNTADLAVADVEAFKDGNGTEIGEIAAAAPLQVRSRRKMSLMAASPMKAAGAGQEDVQQSTASGQSRYQVFNISLGIDEEEQREYEGGFNVSVTLPEAIEGHDFHLYHLHDGGVEEVTDLTLEYDGEVVQGSSGELLTGFSFVTDNFSQFVLGYTVDFHWEVDGKTYEYSIEGGDSISFRELAGLLNVIPAADETGSWPAAYAGGTLDDFIGNIEDIQFSRPELVWTGKLSQDASVSEIIDNNGLEVVYPADMTDEEKAEILTKVYSAGEWILVSVKPFNTEESLTVTMKNGESFVIRVTDAQITARYLAADGTSYDITVIYEKDAQIPDDAWLDVREILPGTAEYADYLMRSAQQLGEGGTESISYARFFDIKIHDEAGEIIEPAAPVLVTIEYADGAVIEAAKDLHVVHFANSGTEVLEGIGVNQEGTVMTYLQNGFSVTGTIVSNPAANDQYMVLIEYDNKYYIVNNDGSLTKVSDTAGSTVEVDEPMMWTYDGQNIYHHSEQTSFNNSQLAADFFNKYIDPTDPEDGISTESRDNTPLRDVNEQYFDWNTWTMRTFTYQVTNDRPLKNNTRLTLSGDRIQSAVNPGQYLGVVEDEEDGVLKLVGGADAGHAATVHLAQAGQVLKTNYLNHVVNHIDISIEGEAEADIPLAYGKYYDANGNMILDVQENRNLHLTSGVVGINMDDMKRAIITAYTKDQNGTTTELDNAFVVNGFSANESTEYSTQQVRIEGDFRVANIPPVTQQYYNSHTQQVWNDRLANKIYYSVTAYKTVEFDLIDPDYGQLYDSEGNKMTVKVDVALSASFDYWDTRNECPPVQWDNTWQSGNIPDHNLSGMDFVLGGNPEGNAKVRAVEVKKIIVDQNGNRIHPKTSIQQSFDIYYNPDSVDASTDGEGTTGNLRNSEAIKDKGSGIYSSYDPSAAGSGFYYQHQKTLRVGEDGVGQLYDYDVNEGVFYITEDTDDIQETILDTSNKTWYYDSTYIETEYVWRNGSYDNLDGRVHTSKTYKDLQNDSYASRAEVLGRYLNYSGSSEGLDNQFLEFTVYNVYRNTLIETKDIDVTKDWPQDKEDEEVQEVYLKLYRKAEGSAEEDVTAIIKGEVQSNAGNIYQYFANSNAFDADSGWIVVKKTSSGWETVAVKNLPVRTAVDENSPVYHYYFREVGYKDAGGQVYNSADSYNPEYTYTVGTDSISQEVPEDGAALTEDMHFKVTNTKTSTTTNYTVSKSFTGGYPTDGSVQVLIALEKGYLQSGESTPTNWTDADTAVVALPRPYADKPDSFTGTEAEWYGSEAAWTYTWTDIPAVQKVESENVPLWYRAKEISADWFGTPVINPAGGQQVVPLTTDPDNSAEVAGQKAVIENQPGTDTLTVNKTWKNGEESETWPAGAEVTVQVVQYWHLAALDTTVSPAAMKEGSVFHTEYLTGAEYTHTLTNSQAYAFTGLPSYAYLEPTDAQIVEAREHGITLESGRKYLVVYTYGAKETGMKLDGQEIDMDLTVPGVQGEGTDKNAFTADIINDLTDLTVKKEWRQSGAASADTVWPEDVAEIKYSIMRVPVYQSADGRTVEFDAEVYKADTETPPLRAANFPDGVSYENLPLQGVFAVTNNEQGMVNGNYPVRYRYYVKESASASTLQNGLSTTEITADPENGIAVLVNEYTGITVEKKWRQADGTTGEMEETSFPADFKVNWKVVRKGSDGSVTDPYYTAYTAPSAGETAAWDNRLTSEKTSYDLTHLPVSGINAAGQQVTYTYEVYEMPEGSEALADNPYPFQMIKAVAGTGNNAGTYTITNDLTKVTVIKEGERGTSVTVQLYATLDKPSDLETVDVKVTLDQWGDNRDPLDTGSVSGTLTGSDDSSRPFTIDPSNNWSKTFAGLPKYQDDGTTEIIYSVNSENIAGQDGVNNLSVVSPGTALENNAYTIELSADGKVRPAATYHFYLVGDGIEIPDDVNIWVQAQDRAHWGNQEAGGFQVSKSITTASPEATLELTEDQVGLNQVQYGVNNLPDGYEIVNPGSPWTANGNGGYARNADNETGAYEIPITIREKQVGPAEGEMTVNFGLIARNNSWQIISAPGRGSIRIKITNNNDSTDVRYVTIQATSWTNTVYLQQYQQNGQAAKYSLSIDSYDTTVFKEVSFENPNVGMYDTLEPRVNAKLVDGYVENQSVSLYNASSRTLMKAPALRANASHQDQTVTAPDETLPGTAGEHKIAVIDKSNLPESAVPVGGEIVLNEDTTPDAWQHTWDKLPKYDAEGNPIYYYVVEKKATTDVDGVTSTTATYDIRQDETTGAFTITITNTTTTERPKTGTIVVEKKLEGVNDPEKSFRISIQRSSTGQYLTGAGSWSDDKAEHTIYAGQKYTFTNLPLGNYVLKEDTSGTEISGYVLDRNASVTGTAESGISVISDGTSEFSFINVYEPVPIRVTKEWRNADGSVNAPAGATVQFQLYRDDAPVGSPVVLDGTADENGEVTPWVAEWKDMPRYPNNDTAQTKYVYTVREVVTGGYSWQHYKPEYPDDNGITYTDEPEENDNKIVNKEETTAIKVTKQWENEQGEQAVSPPQTSIQFALYQAYKDAAGTLHSAVYTHASAKTGEDGTPAPLTDGRGEVKYITGEPGEWETVFIENLPEKVKGEDGEWYNAVYYVAEDGIANVTATYLLDGSGSAKPEDVAASDGKTITIDNRNDSTSLTVEKSWSDLASDTPYAIRFRIQSREKDTDEWEDWKKSGAEEAAVYQLNYNGSTYSIKNIEDESETYSSNMIVHLPAGRQYRVVETGYAVYAENGDRLIPESGPEEAFVTVDKEGTSDTADGGKTWISSLTNRLDTIKTEGRKIWKDDRIHADPKLILKRRVNESDEWEILTASSTDPTRYVQASAGTDISNSAEYTYLQPVWQTRDGKRWYVYNELAKYNGQGLKYTYEVEEQPLQGFEAEYSEAGETYGRDIINTPVGDLLVHKVWFAGAKEEDKEPISYKIEWSTDKTSWKPLKYQEPDGWILAAEGNADVHTLKKNDIVEDSQWTAIFRNLPRMITVTSGNVETYQTVHYRVVELTVGDTEVDYTNSLDSLEGTADNWKVINSAPVELDDDSTAQLTMNNNRQMISISGKKTWVTNKPLNELPDLTLKLISWTDTDADGKPVDEKEWAAVETAVGIQDYQYVILPEGDDNPLEGDASTSRLKWYKNGKTWNYAFTYLPKYDPVTKELLQYRVEEMMSGTNADAFSQEAVPGQSTENGDITNWDFVNTEKTLIKVIKHWKTNDLPADGDPFDPERKVKVELYRKGGGTVDTLGIYEIAKNDDPAEGEEKWQLVIPDLPKYYTDENGDLQTYSYYVIERDTGIWHVEYSTDGENYTVAANQADAQDEAHPIHLENSAWTVELPSTGGPGTNALYLIGFLLMLMAGAGVMAIQRSDKRKGAW